MLNLQTTRLNTTSSRQPTQNQGTEKDEIWSTILKGVASSKMIPTKNVLILGRDPKCGKSTLIHYLKNDPGPQIKEVQERTDTDFGILSNPTRSILPTNKLNQSDIDTLALGYTFVEVKDEENEAMTRLGLYQIGLSSPEYQPLLKFVLNADTLADSCVVICLDWTQPWAFLETLQRWINVLQRAIQAIVKDGSVGESSKSGKVIVDTLCEKVEYYLQTYTETTLPVLPVPSSVPSTPLSANPSTAAAFSVADQVILPLSPGTLTTNFGIPIAIVCCKSDAINSLEQTQDYNEDQFDFIQQTLRCICMKYGASLFYTSTLYPHTFHILHHYLIHRLLERPNTQMPSLLKAQVLERGSVFVPSGWDSWGKVKALRQGFDCDNVHKGWDVDMEVMVDGYQPEVHGVRSVYEEAIPDPSTATMPYHIPITTVCEDEQVFLERHFETLERVSEAQGKRGTPPPEHMRPSAVGPLGFLPVPGDTSKTRSATDTETRSYKESPLDKLMYSKTTTTSSIDHRQQRMRSTQSTGTNIGLGLNDPSHANAGETGPSHEVLANFFQSLLSKKSSTASLGSISSSSGLQTSPSMSNAPTDSEHETKAQSTVNRKEVHEQLNKMRQNNP
ncbi:dynein light intermediate chain-domain-containing protein [Spinellus fusiger]|nr:dynein light intermediate chain-domain-containing protein [Spinellus fusiger]